MTAHPRLPGRLWLPGEPLADAVEHWEVVGTSRRFDGGFVSLREDTVRAPDGDEFDRAVVEHHGAVGVVALDEVDRVLLLLQYRHAAGHRLLQLPAGLLDVGGEPPREAAARELAEEADLVGDTWSELAQAWSSPGMTDEHWQLFEVHDLGTAPADSVPERQHEEAHMEAVWVPLGDAVRAVLQGRLTDALTVIGLLATWARRTGADRA